MMVVLQLFWSFCQIGFTSFGGLFMIPLISSEMTGHGWMTSIPMVSAWAVTKVPQAG